MSIMLRPKLWTERHSESRSDMAIARAGDCADGVEVPSAESAGALLLRLLHAFRHALQASMFFKAKVSIENVCRNTQIR